MLVALGGLVTAGVTTAVLIAVTGTTLACANLTRGPANVAKPAVGGIANDPLRKKQTRRCPDGMVNVDDAYCIDTYEASIVEVGNDGIERLHSYYLPVPERSYKAVSMKGALPQAYISHDEAEFACKAANKRLCKRWEWKQACRGSVEQHFPYGDTHIPKTCNDHGDSPLRRIYGDKPPRTWQSMNNPALDKLPGTVAVTGSHAACRSDYGTYDMVGNLHEWTAEGPFVGGYFLDVTQNGEGCEYQTVAHNKDYHDYSTGFRCCAETVSETR
jgi:formylglycine-generating enzyme